MSIPKAMQAVTASSGMAPEASGTSRSPSAAAALSAHTVVPGDRLDLLSFRLTGDPLGFWRICDANAALDPDDLVDAEAVGTRIVVPLPGAVP